MKKTLILILVFIIMLTATACPFGASQPAEITPIPAVTPEITPSPTPKPTPEKKPEQTTTQTPEPTPEPPPNSILEHMNDTLFYNPITDDYVIFILYEHTQNDLVYTRVNLRSYDENGVVVQANVKDIFKDEDDTIEAYGYMQITMGLVIGSKTDNIVYFTWDESVISSYVSKSETINNLRNEGVEHYFSRP